MAFYVMHDTFICHKQTPRTNYILNNSKYNLRKEEWLRPKKNDKTNEPTDITKNLKDKTEENIEHFRIKTDAEVSHDQTLEAHTKTHQHNELTHLGKEKSRKNPVGKKDKQEINKDLGVGSSEHEFVGEKLPEINHTIVGVSSTNLNLDNSSIVAEGERHFKLNTFELDKKLEIDDTKLVSKHSAINSRKIFSKDVETKRTENIMQDDIKKRNDTKLTEKETNKQSRNTKMKKDQQALINKPTFNSSEEGKFTPHKSNKQIQIDQRALENFKETCMEPKRMHDARLDRIENKIDMEEQIIIQETQKVNNTNKEPNKTSHLLIKSKTKNIERIIQKEYDRYRKIIVQNKTPKHEYEKVTSKLKAVEVFEIKNGIEMYKEQVEKNFKSDQNKSIVSGSDDMSLCCDDSQIYWIFLAVSWLPVFCLLSWLFSFLQIALCI